MARKHFHSLVVILLSDLIELSGESKIFSVCQECSLEFLTILKYKSVYEACLVIEEYM